MFRTCTSRSDGGNAEHTNVMKTSALSKNKNKKHPREIKSHSLEVQTVVHHTAIMINTINIVFLPMLGALSEKRFPYMLLASKKAPSSRTSSSMVAVWACSVLFMSCHDSRASGRSKLSTVCTTAWHMQEV